MQVLQTKKEILKMDKKKYAVPALEKGLLICELLADSDQPLGITEINAICGLPKSSVFSIMTTLENMDYVEKLPDDKYKLTLKINNLGTKILTKLDVRQVSRPIMEELAEQLRFTVHLAILEKDKSLYVEKVNGPGFVQFSTAVGQSWPIYISAGGKVLAAYLPSEQLAEVLKPCTFEPYTPNTIRSKEALMENLDTVRENGYAFEDEEGEIGIRCIAAPVYDKAGTVIASLGVTALRNELPVHKLDEIGRFVRNKALTISAKLGYVPHEAEPSEQKK